MDASSDETVLVIPLRNSGEYQEVVAQQASSSVQFGSFSSRSPGSGGVDCALGYRRWLEFDPVNGAGQDAAAIRSDGRYVVGVVADGVSQSFFGEIAAWNVAGLLVRFLWDRRKLPAPLREIEARLSDFQKEVDIQYVRSRTLPAHLFEIQRDALEATRQSGSQTVFAAFLLDVDARRATVYQVGDVDAIVTCVDGEQRFVRADPAGRWSSAGQSEMRMDRKDFHNVVSVLLKSDGVGASWGSPADGVYDPERFAALAREKAEKDDLSYVCVQRWAEEKDSQISSQLVRQVESSERASLSPKPPPRLEKNRVKSPEKPEPKAGPPPPPPRRIVQDVREQQSTPKQRDPVTITLKLEILLISLAAAYLLGLLTAILLTSTFGTRNAAPGQAHSPYSSSAGSGPGKEHAKDAGHPKNPLTVK